jgi:hypothetical protein
LAASRLTALQRDFLAAFFQRERSFFLTGGGALSGFHLAHRETYDLDLFTTSDTMDSGVEALAGSARALGGSLEAIQTSPDFRRFLLTRGNDSIRIDLVRERAPQVIVDKPEREGIRVDPPEEILANKLCALLSRLEIRDLVDVLKLEEAGYRVDDALEAAHRKDAGLTPAQLAWVLSQIEIGKDAVVPGEVSLENLRRYLKGLIDRLSHLAFPSDRTGQ